MLTAFEEEMGNTYLGTPTYTEKIFHSYETPQKTQICYTTL